MQLPRRSPAFASLCALLLASCASPPLAETVPLRALEIRNPERLSLELERVGCGRISLGSRPLVTLDLEAARYVVHAGGHSWPAPLLAPVVPEDRTTLLSVRALPPAPPGFALVPGGPTLLGDVLGVGAADERPARVAVLAPFCIAETETTNAQYAAFLNAEGRCEEEWLDLGGPKCGVRRDGAGRFVTDAPRMPVVTVTLPGARAYCAWKSRTTGTPHRLPTEEEWERFARGPCSTTYAYGDVYDPEAANQESGKLVPVASFPETGWGVRDATGNAFEWTASAYEPGLQVLKGGSYVLDGPYLRNSFRMWYRPLVKADDIGFRVLSEIRP